MHTDQEPHFIVIGTIYFMSQWLYFFCPSHSSFFFSFSYLLPLFKMWTSQLYRCRRYSDSWCAKTTITRWRGESTVNRCFIRFLASGIQAVLQLLCMHLTDAQRLPHLNLLPPTCQNVNVICSPRLSSSSSPLIRDTSQLSDVCVPRVWPLNSVPVIMHTSWHTFQLKCVSLQQSNIRWPCWLVKPPVPTVTDYPNHPTDCAA